MDDALIKALFAIAILDALMILVASLFVPASLLPTMLIRTLVGNVIGWASGWVLYKITKRIRR